MTPPPAYILSGEVPVYVFFPGRDGRWVLAKTTVGSVEEFDSYEALLDAIPTGALVLR